jgi:hypothetical protein
MNENLVMNKLKLVEVPYGINLNVSLMADPTIYQKFVALPLSGIFMTSENDTDSLNVKLPKLPIHYDDGKQVQIFMS